MKNIFFIVISLSFSLIHAQFVSRSEVMSQIDVFLQKMRFYKSIRQKSAAVAALLRHMPGT